jgi:hypothetical protein
MSRVGNTRESRGNVSRSRENPKCESCKVTMCYVTAGTFTRLGLCRLPYDKALVSRVLSISHDE